MEICNSGHQEIVYDGVTCPLCEALEDNMNLEAEVEDLQTQLMEAKGN